MTRRFLALLAAVFVASLIFRFAVVETYHSSSPDGKQYWLLAQELIRDGRYAFSPAAPLSWVRPPGHPLFLAAFVDHFAAQSHEHHAALAARWNVLCDLASALLVFALVRAFSRRETALGAFAGVIVAPLLLLFSAFALSESLSTLLGLCELYCAIRAMRGRLLPWAIAAGAFAGLSQLVRADAIVMAPAVALAIVFATATRREKLRAIAAGALTAAIVFAPWPLRNLARFGAAHPLGAEYFTDDGTPLAPGLIRWLRTWADGAPEDGDFTGRIYFGIPPDPSRIGPKMVDGDEERAELGRLLAARDFRSDAADRAFTALAEARTRRHPLRTFVTLPARRLARLYAPARNGDYPLRIAWLGLPAHRDWFGVFDACVYLLALAGAALTIRNRERRKLGLILLAAIAARSLLHSFAVPMYVSQRYLVEVYPLLVALAALAVDEVASLLHRRQNDANERSE